MTAVDHAEMKRLAEGEDTWLVGHWLAAALDDPLVCDEMKEDIRGWFNGNGHLRSHAALLSEIEGLKAERDALRKSGDRPRR